jgi:hypothetical protein
VSFDGERGPSSIALRSANARGRIREQTGRRPYATGGARLTNIDTNIDTNIGYERQQLEQQGA